MRTILWLTVFFLLGTNQLFAQGEPAPTPSGPASFQTSEERYRIGFQDTLEIQIFRRPELNQRVNVNPNGTITLFRLDAPIVAVCKSERELANEIATAYAKNYLRNPEVNVIAVEQRSQSFAVMGAVEKPANYYINRPIRLLELLAQAGGPTDKAGSRLIVARTGSRSNCRLTQQRSDEDTEFEIVHLSLKDVLEAKQNIPMLPGDIVSVLEADVVYVYGHVVKQGQVIMKEPLTLTQAIASAEGLKPASRTDVRIFRQKQGSLEREELLFNLGDIEKRKVADPYLEPNDIVAVNEDRVKSIFNSIGRSLTNGIPSIFYRVP
ncbi:MAG: SLBB domain-containing protein [Acidobacteria bacterium]|nr:SLBB domain-containing protein [Acidobacteriota bacterium]